MCVHHVGSGEFTIHFSPGDRGPGTSLAFTCKKSECLAHARAGGGGGGGGVQMTGALLDVLLCSIAKYFYELCRIVTSP